MNESRWGYVAGVVILVVWLGLAATVGSLFDPNEGEAFLLAIAPLPPGLYFAMRYDRKHS